MAAAALGSFGEAANFTGALELGIGGVGLDEEERLVDGDLRRQSGGVGGPVAAVVMVVVGVAGGGRGTIIIHEEEELKIEERE